VIAGMVLVLFMRQRGVPLFAPAANEPTARTVASPPVAQPPPQQPPDAPTGPWG
jgi:hypothetical protein